jgi:hypothetical protein
MKYVLTVVIALAVLVVGAFLFAWSGIYNISATKPHWDITLAFIEMLRDRSIAMRSDDIQALNLGDPKLEEAAFSNYHGMCRFCHGAPEYQPEEFAKGLYPSPPRMTAEHIQQTRSDTEIYWIVKHGIKMTGMPAFGPTHTEAELWGLTALAKEMPRMTSEQYRRQLKAAGAEEDQSHGHGQAESSDHSEAEEEHH